MGGSKPQQPTFITPPPPQITQAPPPNVQQNAEDLYSAQLKYNPLLTSQAAQLQQQYGPQLAQSQTDIQRQQAPQLAQSQFDLQQQYGPLYRALYTQLFPTQVAGQEQLAQQSLQRLQSPQGLTPEQQAYQDTVRGREQERFLRGIRTQANVGGTLYGGQRERRETEGLAELAGQYSQQDLALEQMRRAQTLQELIASSQVVFPQVQQPGVAQPGAPQFGQGVTPSADALLAAILQGQIISPAQLAQGTPGTPGLAGPLIGAAGGVAAAKIFVMCLPATTLVDTSFGEQPIETLQAGDALREGIVLFKSEYAPQDTCFVKLMLADGRWVETCDLHVVAGRPAMAYQVGEALAESQVVEKQVTYRNERTYDLLTSAVDGGYTVQGISVATMIPTLHRVAKELEGLPCLSC